MAIEAKASNKNIITYLLVALSIACAFWGPCGGEITKEMSSTVFLIVAAIIMWITKCVPIIASSLFIITLMPLCGIVSSLSAAFGGFTSTSTYFVIGSMAFGLAIEKTPIPTKILAKLIKWSKGKTSTIALAFLFTSYFISMWVSDIGAMMVSLCLAILFIEEAAKAGYKDIKRLTTLLGLCTPVGAVLGGNTLVVGSTVNVVTLNMLQAQTGETVSFLQWLAIGGPACLVTLLLMWQIMPRIFKADDIPADMVEKFSQSLAERKSSLKHPAITYTIIVAVVVLWFASTWISWLDITSVSLIALVVLCIPEFDILKADELLTKIPWDVLFLGSCSVMLGKTANSVGVATLIASKIGSVAQGTNIFVMTFILCVALTVIVILVPVGPACASMMTVPIYMVVQGMGYNPIIGVMVVGIFAANASIFPLNATFLVPYSKGMFDAKDMAKNGVILTLIWIVICSVWLPLSVGWFC